MERSILIVNATQVVTSQANPDGLLSVVSGFPVTFDSKKYNGDAELTMKKAKAKYFDQLSKNYDDTNASRIIKTVTLERVNGDQVLHESIGGFIEEQTE